MTETSCELWPGVFEVVVNLPDDHVVIGGVMVFLHGAVSGRQPVRVTRDVDVLCDVEVSTSSIRETVAALEQLGYVVAADAPNESTHRYRGPNGEQVDVLAPSGVKPPPDLTTTPPGKTIEVPAGREALRHRVVVQATYGDRSADLLIPDMARALKLKAAAYGQEYGKSPAKAWNSRHLEDLAFLTSLLTDPEPVIAGLGEAGSNLHLADVLDDPGHHAWVAAGDLAEDGYLTWEVIRHAARSHST
ncbi:hypothetical protein [Lentzea aerocolonigenes]|uniref:hypothetical protein n=1 Tax=Lentzea aerocolonigenes TaxID=68170 RepID=UPI0012E2E45A|nr:hypothetical protein [Lentzea aerocolonigenes]